MDDLAVEVNDAGLVALRGGASTPLPESPGLALLDGGRVLVGAEAAARARLKPRLVHDTFWDRLDAEPAGLPFPDGVSRADLAYAHLQALGAAAGAVRGETFLAVPGFWSPAALGLLLSVARAAGLLVVGLADAAVAAASAGPPGETLLHVDLTRHRSVVTAIVRGGDELVRQSVVPSEGRGWKDFEETWAAAVAGQFVRETRFDPLHAAASEQALYDALPGWLRELCGRPAISAALQAGGREHRVELLRSSVASAASELYRGLAEQVSLVKVAGEPATVLLSHRAARLPGIADRLREIRGVTVAELPPTAAVKGVLRHRDFVRRGDDALPFVTRLPSGGGAADGEAPSIPAAARSSADSPRPTHVVHEGIAHAIGAPGLSIGTAPPAGGPTLALRGDTYGVSRHHCTLVAEAGEAHLLDHSRRGTFVNGEKVTACAVVHAGDRILLGRPGLELLLIAVKD